MNISKFTKKLNKLENNTYVIEEEIIVTNGVYEAELEHDNINLKTLNVYTGSKLTGNKIETYFTSTPSLAPWKTIIKIFSSVTPVYVSYETQGDTVEADDINYMQDAIIDTQNNLNDEISRAENSETVLTNNLNSEITRAKGVENTLTNNLATETNRAKSAESTLTANLNSEITRATNAESTLTNNLNSEINRAKAAENTLTNTINANTPIWNDKYTKNEVDNKISQVVSNMDWKESVATYADIATTYPTPDDGWTVNVKDTDITYRYSGSAWIPISANSIPLAASNVDGKMSKQDKIDHDDMNSKKHTHSNKSILDIITQTLIDNWNAAFTHVSDAVRHITSTERSNWNTAYTNNHIHSNKSILDVITQALIDSWNSAYTHVSDTIKHITSDERTLWNTVSNKVDKITGKSLSTNDFDNNYKTKIDGISSNANKVEASTTNGNIKIDSVEKTVYVHPTGTNPHGTTKSDVGLSNVDNTSDLNKPISTAMQTALNGKANSSHTHDDRYYTETEADTKFATKSEISALGSGDMLKSVYDTNGDGIVDNADKLDGKEASDFAPSGYGLGTTAKDVSSTDINSLQTTGFFKGCTMTNAPSNGWYYLIVIAYGTGWSVQYATGFGTGSTNNAPNNMYMRTLRNGTWDSWIQILMASKGINWNQLKGV